MTRRPGIPRALRRRSGLALGIGLGVLVLIAFTAFVLKVAEDAVRREAEDRVGSGAQLAAQLLDEQTLRFEELVGAYGARLRGIRPPERARLARPADRLAARDTLTDLVAGVDGVDGALLADPLGRVVAAAPPGRIATGTDLSGREWYRGVTRIHRAYRSRAYLSLAAGHPKITTVAVPLRGRGGTTLGILVVSESARTQAAADELGRRLDTDLVITDQAGTVVARTGRPTGRLLSRMDDPLVKAALAGRRGVEDRTLDGVHLVSGYAPVARSNWAVVSDVKADAAFDGVPRLRAALLAASFIVAFVLLWLVPLLVGRLRGARDALDVSDAFQSDLLPRVLPAGVRAHYVPSEKRMLLGGDFLDAVRTPDGSLAVCIGDVCGHGPRAAALGATLRAGWRTLASAGSPVDRLDLLDRLVESQRPDDHLFATMACAVLTPDGRTLRLALAGHPPPVFVTEDGDIRALDERRGPALGLGAGGGRGVIWPVSEHAVHGSWSFALYTDGLIEARSRKKQERLGLDGLLALVRQAWRPGGLDADAVLAHVAALAGPQGSDDDVAMLLVDGATVRGPQATPPRLGAAHLG